MSVFSARLGRHLSQRPDLVHRAACFSCLSETWESGLGLRPAWVHGMARVRGVPWGALGLWLAWVRGAPSRLWLAWVRGWPGFVAGLGLRVI